MKRRHALALVLGGLASTPSCDKHSPEAPEKPASKTGAAKNRPLEGQSLVPVKINPALETRTLVGLRPYRPSGFVVRRDDINGKTLIHNYGHGGGGVTLSWGSSHLAIQLAGPGPLTGQSCAIIGGGVMGLSTARLLQLRGAKVTLYTRDLPPETTSNIAGAQWWPVSLFDPSRRTEPFATQFVEAANFSYRYFQHLLGPTWGVRWLPNYYLSEGPPLNGWVGGPGGVLHHLQIGFQDFGPGEHIFPSQYVRRFHSMLIEPSVYLSKLMLDVQSAGATIEIRHFSTGQEILDLPHTTIFNCTGLGARELFNDEELGPAKGQLSVLMPQPEVAYNLITDYYYMFPRSDGIILGGTFERGQSDLTPNAVARQRVLETHQRLFHTMKNNQLAATSR